jgi:hypothetical protein
LYDNALANQPLATQQKMAYLVFQYFDHPLYSPDVVLPDYHVFPGLKKLIEKLPFFVRQGGHCSRGDLVGWTNFCYFSGLQKLEQRVEKCVELLGMCVG